MNNELKYTSNIFFFKNNLYFHILNPQPQLVYNIHYLLNNYFIEIKNKKNEPLNIFFKIINNKNHCFYFQIFKNTNNFIKLNLKNIKFSRNHKDNIYINPQIIHKINELYPNFEPSIYNENLFNLELTSKNIDFLKYNWIYFGLKNNYQYFKYIIYKNKILFHKLLQKINYNLTYHTSKKYTLLFIDDRYDSIFQYILILFLYSIDNNWNLTIFTTKNNSIHYENCLNKLNIQYKINIIPKIENINNYSNLLKSYEFWNQFNEDFVLLFQYDSLAFKKFDYKFLDYNYIGAQWPKHIQQLKDIYNGNGGTSLRNVNIMKEITNEYNYKNDDINTPEDMYFAKYLYEKNILMNDSTICDEFSFENIYNEESIYCHALYECISLQKMEEYICNRIDKLLNT
jgi:hypothetical protein